MLLREIARGGMGEIWLALERAAGQVERLVVIKRVIGSAEDDPMHATLFLDEARIAAQLHHPNVVQVFAVGELEGSHYLVMEYLPGQSLGRVVRAVRERSGALHPVHAVRLIADAARGLGYAHRRRGLDGQPLRIVHRDVSPQNLLVTYDGQLKVLDFGIASAEGKLSKTATGLVRGKITYMSPEQAAGLRAAPASDVFSLGVVLWELLSGRRLHRDQDDIVVLRKLAMETAPFDRVSRHVPTVDAALDALVARCLERDPGLRFADGVELAAALDGWLARNPLPERLDALMERVFGSEINALPEMHRALSVTPSVAVERSVPEAGAAKTEISVSTRSALQAALPRRSRWAVGAVVSGLAALVAAAWLIARNDTRDGAPAAMPPVGSAPVLPGVADAGTSTSVMDAGSVLVAAPQALEVDAGTPIGEEQVTVDAGAALTVAPAPRARGALTLDTEPWTRVSLAGRVLGETPLIDVPLPVGTHRLKLVNREEGVETFVEVVITAGKTTTKQYHLK